MNLAQTYTVVKQMNSDCKTITPRMLYRAARAEVDSEQEPYRARQEQVLRMAYDRFYDRVLYACRWPTTPWDSRAAWRTSYSLARFQAGPRLYQPR
jgi:hypothetical protein